MTTIEWTDRTWNFAAGCTPVVENAPENSTCPKCYAARMAYRLEAMGMRGYEGLTKKTTQGITWTGKVNFIPEALEKPLRRKKPTRWFVNSMFDAGHEGLTIAQLDQAFAVMAKTPQHTYQMLTKRPDHLLEYLSGLEARIRASFSQPASERTSELRQIANRDWPLANVWIGVTVEHPNVKHRIDTLCQIPATVRFISFEPVLADLGVLDLRGIDWAIVGGQSGANPAPFHWEHADGILTQCRAAGTAFFMKQGGSNPYLSGQPFPMSGSGGDIHEFPLDLQIREFPTISLAA